MSVMFCERLCINFIVGLTICLTKFGVRLVFISATSVFSFVVILLVLIVLL